MIAPFEQWPSNPSTSPINKNKKKYKPTEYNPPNDPDNNDPEVFLESSLQQLENDTNPESKEQHQETLTHLNSLLDNFQNTLEKAPDSLSDEATEQLRNARGDMEILYDADTQKYSLSSFWHKCLVFDVINSDDWSALYVTPINQNAVIHAPYNDNNVSDLFSIANFANFCLYQAQNDSSKDYSTPFQIGPAWIHMQTSSWISSTRKIASAGLSEKLKEQWLNLPQNWVNSWFIKFLNDTRSSLHQDQIK